MSGQLILTSLQPWTLVRRETTICTSLAINKFPRLDSVVDSSSADLVVEFSVTADRDRALFLALSLRGELKLLCMRCLADYSYAWSSQSRLLLEQPLDRVRPMTENEDFERVSLADDGSFNLIEVISDELLLGLPEKHQGDCPDDLIGNYNACLSPEDVSGISV